MKINHITEHYLTNTKNQAVISNATNSLKTDIPSKMHF